MKNKFIILMIVSLVLFFSLILIKINSNKMIEDVKYDSFLLNLLINNLNKQTESDNVYLSDNISLVSDMGKRYYLTEVVDGTKFIIRFRGSQCQSCVNQFNKHVSELVEIIDEIGVESVVVVLDTKNKGELQLVKNQVKCSVYGMQIGDMPIELESKEELIPYYYFVITEDLLIQSCFIPSDEFRSVSKCYIDSMKRKFEK